MEIANGHKRRISVGAVSLVVFVVLLSLALMVPRGHAGAIIYTDKADYHPEEVVTIYGYGFNPDSNITLSITRGDGSVDSCDTSGYTGSLNDTGYPRIKPCPLMSDSSGTFVEYYDLDGVTGAYSIVAWDGTSFASTAFTDAVNISIQGTDSNQHVTEANEENLGQFGPTTIDKFITVKATGLGSGNTLTWNLVYVASAENNTILFPLTTFIPSSGTLTKSASTVSVEVKIATATLASGIYHGELQATGSGVSPTPSPGVYYFKFTVDTSPPIITPTVNPSPNANGWNNGNVTVIWSVADPESGIASSSGCGTTTLVSQTSGTILTCTATNGAGASRSVSVTVKIDKTSPTIAGSASPGPNANGWNNGPVTVSFTCLDALSGVGSLTAPTIRSGEGSGQSATGTCTDNAGNSASTTVGGVNIDLTSPTLTGSRTPVANSFGWNNGPVTASFTCSDSLSGVSSVSSPIVLNSDGAGQSVTGTCTDKAGNTGSTSITGINIDQTAPSLTGVRSPSANSNGWNNVDVTVSFTCTDGLSGVNLGPVTPQVVSTEGVVQARSASCNDKAGNSASATVSGISIDKTAPTVSGSKSPGPNGNDWNNGTVTVTFACADALSGVASSPLSPQALSGEGAGQSRTGTCEDMAGNTSSATVGDINIDLTLPVILGSRSVLPNGNGWNNVPVTISFSCSDVLSGAYSYSTPSTVGEGAGQSVTGVCIDEAGNSASATVLPVNVDLTPPNITGSSGPSPNVSGWNNGPVTVSFTCSDSLSGVFSTTDPLTLNSEGYGQSATGVCTDSAGNFASMTISGINIDLTLPVISGSRTPSSNSFGWNNGPVTVSYDCSDILSGVASVSGSTTLISEGSSQSVTGTCADLAGNMASTTVDGIDIDLTPPVVVGSRSPSSNANGWNNVDVNVSFTCTDDLSGVDAVSSDQTVSSEGSGQSRTGSCVDKAGNSASSIVTAINIDKTSPDITASKSPGPNAYGWNNEDVTVSFTCTDALSGVDTAPSSPQLVSTEGEGQSRSATCADFAGNVASVTVDMINVDKTAPIISGSRTPEPNINDWNNGPVAVSFTCSDDLSGVATSPESPQIVSTEGSGQSRTGTCIDMAGNSASTTVDGINTDFTVPTISFSRSVPPNANGWSNEPVTVSFFCSDLLSGVLLVSPSATLAEGASQSVTGICADMAGNSASINVDGINIDLTPPVIDGSRSPDANTFGWTNLPVTVSFSCSDSLSGVDVVSSPSTLGEGASQSIVGTCTDNAGNAATTTLTEINVDLTPPTILGSRSPDANAYGWNNSPVTISFTCTDDLSGVESASLPTILGEGVSQSVTGSCVDFAGNPALATIGGVNVDMSDPVITASRSVGPNADGWNNVPVVVDFICDDALSGVLSVSPSSTLVEGAGQSTTGFCFDVAGNSDSAALTGINIDLTSPIIASSRSVESNVNGWNSIPVTVSFLCSDALSGVSNVSPSATLGEGLDQSATGICSDLAGNQASVVESGINVDLSPPVITGSRSPDANSNGWTDTPVTVSFSCVDDLSGVESYTPPSVLGEGLGQSLVGTCVDRAGNPASALVADINVDLTGPIITGSRNPVANSLGWNNGPVTISFVCSDLLSGVSSLTLPSTLSAEGALQSAIGVCIDNAGNSASTIVGDINIDLTGPIVSSYRSIEPNVYGWNNSPVTLSFSCTDSLSGVDFVSSPTTLGEGAGQSATGVCSDKSGNTATVTESGVNVDLTPPAIAGSRSPGPNAYGWNNADVTVSFTCSDSLSGIATSPVSPQNVSSEGVGQSRTVSCIDKAGNTSSATVGSISIDKTIPLLTWTRSPLANVFGWNNVSVTVAFGCSDALSGVASYSPSSTVSTEGAGQSVTGNCQDKAGNMASVSVGSGINIDKTSPQTTITVGSPKFTSGTALHVSLGTTFTLTGTDFLSGVCQTKYGIDDPSAPTTYAGPFSIPSKGPHTVYFKSIDRALNVESIKSLTVVVGATTIAYTGSTQGVYSDPAMVRALLIDVASQQPITGKLVSFSLGSQSNSATTDGTGVATSTIVLNQAAGSYTVVASFAGDSSLQASIASVPFTLIKESAVLSYAGDTVVSTGAKYITLTAMVQEVPDGSLGDLARARVTFRIYASDNSQTLLQTTGPVPVVLTSTPGVGFATIQISNMQENTYLITVSLDSAANSYYSAPNTDPVVLTVYQPNGSYVTGGGWIVDSSGSHGNFGFVVRYNSAGNVQGHAVYVYRVGGLDYMVKSNAWIGMAIVGNHAYFQGKATLQIMDPATGVVLYSVGNYQFRVDVYDNTGTATNGGVDTYQIAVWDNTGLVYHQASGSLMGGQIMVHDSKP